MRHKFNVGDGARCLSCFYSDNCKVEEVRIENFSEILYLVGNYFCSRFVEEDELELVEWK